MRKIYDIIGVGSGVFNLSLNALLYKTPIRSIFIDSKERISWYPNLLIDNAKIQNSYLRDLVSLIDPGNRYSFVSYLNEKKRLYSFLNAGFEYVLRAEFADYLSWVSERMDNIIYGNKVIAVRHAECLFEVETANKEKFYAKNLSIGVGRIPKLPDTIRQLSHPRIIHAIDVKLNELVYSCKNLLIVGGGQTSAEIFEHILMQNNTKIERIVWVSSRHNFLPIDDSPFVNEYFTPTYINAFLGYENDVKNKTLSDQKLASDGISHSTLDSIYRLLYKNKYLPETACRKQTALLPNHILTDIKIENNESICAKIFNKCSQNYAIEKPDFVILCTGFENALPAFLKPVQSKLKVENDSFVLNDDYSIASDIKCNKIFMLNGAKHTHGISDPNISTMAWRSAKIVNSVLKFQFYNTKNSDILSTF